MPIVVKNNINYNFKGIRIDRLLIFHKAYTSNTVTHQSENLSKLRTFSALTSNSHLNKKSESLCRKMYSLAKSSTGIGW